MRKRAGRGSPPIGARARCTHDRVSRQRCRTGNCPACCPSSASGQRQAVRRAAQSGRRGLMRLSWNEVRARAAAFAEDWKDAAYEKGETQSFYNAFFDVFGVRRRNVARYEAHVAKLDTRSGFIDLFWPGVLIVEQKSAGRDLKAAYEQAGEYFDALPECEPPALHPCERLPDLRASRPRRARGRRLRARGPARACRGVRLHPRRAAPDLPRPGPGEHQGRRAGRAAARRARRCRAPGARSGTLPRARRVLHVRRRHRGVRAARHLPRLHRDTHGRGRGRSRPVARATVPGARHAGGERAATLDEDLARFPYVNGDLFEGQLRMFSFDAAMRGALLDACRFDWSIISPAIFGALFQSVMDPAERRAQGAHYTTEKNISR